MGDLSKYKYRSFSQGSTDIQEIDGSAAKPHSDLLPSSGWKKHNTTYTTTTTRQTAKRVSLRKKMQNILWDVFKNPFVDH